MADKYRIANVSDFFAVPVEKREHCLHDFRLWLECLDELGTFFGGIDGVGTVRDEFVWIDDGKSDVNVGVEINGTRPSSSSPQEP